MPKLNILLAACMMTGAVALAGCSSPPPQTTATETDETTTAQPPAPMPAPVPGAPGTVTTQTTHSVTSP